MRLLVIDIPAVLLYRYPAGAVMGDHVGRVTRAPDRLGGAREGEHHAVLAVPEGRLAIGLHAEVAQRGGQEVGDDAPAGVAGDQVSVRRRRSAKTLPVPPMAPTPSPFGRAAIPAGFVPR